MRKHRNQLLLMASKERVNMANKHNKITMQMLQSSMEYWSKYTNRNNPKRDHLHPNERTWIIT
jgi:hypothetical protein